MMEKKIESVSPPPPSSVGDYDDSQSTYTVDQPPPAYRKLDLPTVKVTKIIAVTLLLVTLIAGLTAVAIVYLQHNLKCAHMMESIQQKSPNELPQPSKIIQEKSGRTSTKQQPTKDKVNLRPANPDLTSGETQDQMKKLNFPIHIDLDDITGKMMEKNQRARLNCVIEKKRSEEIIPRSSKTIQTPFGNLTTDPKFTHITGETMSLTCRGGNDRVDRPLADSPTVNSPPSPILIQIPIQKEMNPLPASGLHQMRPQLPLARLNSLINLIRPPPPSPIHINPPQPQPVHPNAPQLLISPSHQVNIQGPFPISPIIPGPHLPPQPQQPPPQRQQQQQQEQQPPQQQILENPLQRLLNPFQHIRIPLLPFPQLNLHQMIPHLLDVHKQIQQQREKADQQRQQQKDQSNEGNNNKFEQRHEQESEENEGPSEGRPININHPMGMRDSHESMNSQGRAIRMHDGPMQRMSAAPPPIMGGHMAPPPHLREQIHQQHEPINALRPQEGGPIMMRDLPNMEELVQHGGRHEEERGGMEMNLDSAPSFHNNPHILPPEDMMYRDGPPMPFMVRSHNMQPRSSVHPRMKRMAAGSCSCVCK